MKQIIQHMGQWQFVIANKIIIEKKDQTECHEMEPSPLKDRAMHEGMK
jgi:hypothetical protein